MAKRRPRHGQNPRARAYVGPVLVTVALLITGAMFLQSYNVTGLKLAAMAATIVTITTWQVLRQKRRAKLGAAERPPAEPPGYTPAEPPPTEDSPPL